MLQADTKELSQKSQRTRYYGIETIVVKPGKIEVIKEKAPEVAVYPGLELDLNGIDSGTKKVFKDNSWDVGDMIKDYAKDVVDSLNAMKQQYEADGYDRYNF